MFDKYINLPYKTLGRGFDGVDCFGLGWLIYKEELNIELPDFTDLLYDTKWYNNGNNHILNNIDNTWDIAIKLPYKRYDFHIFFLGTTLVANHIGIHIGENKFIHIYEGNLSMISRLDRYWSSKLYKTIRYKRVT